MHECSTSVYLNNSLRSNGCIEKNLGEQPRSIMTKGTSTRAKSPRPYGNFDPGNEDKLMISYSRDRQEQYSLDSACGVVYEGNMHFFGGSNFGRSNDGYGDFRSQHLVIEKSKGKLPRLIQKELLDLRISSPACSVFEWPSERFPYLDETAVFICFAIEFSRSCVKFDGNFEYLSENLIKTYYSYFHHNDAGLVKYNGKLLTFGGANEAHLATELMERYNGSFRWTHVQTDFGFTNGHILQDYSLVTVDSVDFKDEFVLLIGGNTIPAVLHLYEEATLMPSEDVYKFNGTWFHFGKLMHARHHFSSIYWNGRVYIIGGQYMYNSRELNESEWWSKTNYGRDTNIEIWNIIESPDRFQTSENWPILFSWFNPHLFIVSDSFFPTR